MVARIWPCWRAFGGSLGRVARHAIDVRDATAEHGYANALRDLPEQEHSRAARFRSLRCHDTGRAVLLILLALAACKRETRDVRTDPPVQAALDGIRLDAGRHRRRAAAR